MCEEMSLAMNIISGLKIAGMISGGYTGYQYGDDLKKWVCCSFPSIKRYHNEYVSVKFKKSQIRENTLFNLIGCFSGILGGFYIWPVSIPIMIYQMAEDYPDEIKKLKKFIKD